MTPALLRALIFASAASAASAEISEVQAAEQPSLLEAATFVLKSVTKYGVGTVSETSKPCVFELRQNLVENNASHRPYSPYKQIDFRRVQQVQIGGAPGTYSVQRMIISGDPGTYCHGTIFPEDPEQSGIARPGDNGCANELVVWSGDTGVALERVAKAVLYISQNFCPYGGKPY